MAVSVLIPRKQHTVGPLPRNASRRTIHTRRYAKGVPGHHIQVDVKFLALTSEVGRKIRRYQYTAIDDATRIHALKIYQRHNHHSTNPTRRSGPANRGSASHPSQTTMGLI